MTTAREYLRPSRWTIVVSESNNHRITAGHYRLYLCAWIKAQMMIRRHFAVKRIARVTRTGKCWKVAE